MRDSSFAAVMFRSVAASKPSRDSWPSLSIPERPAAVLSAIDMMGYGVGFVLVNGC